MSYYQIVVIESWPTNNKLESLQRKSTLSKSAFYRNNNRHELAQVIYRPESVLYAPANTSNLPNVYLMYSNWRELWYYSVHYIVIESLILVSNVYFFFFG